ncbi:MAG: rhodanese-like domain-containing protein [Myxococcota bacterium]
MESGLYWVLGFVAVAAIAYFLFRPKRGSSTDLVSSLQRGALLLDVRSPSEFADGHVEGARNVPVDAVQSAIDSLGEKTQPIVVYCRSGARSAQAARLLMAAGYSDVVNGGSVSAVRSAKQAASVS